MLYFEKAMNGEIRNFAIRFSRQGKATFAELFEVEENDGLVNLGVMTIANPHYTDQFVKKIGTKIALTYLLDILSDPEAVADTTVLLDKEDRAKIWAEFFKTHKK